MSDTSEKNQDGCFVIFDKGTSKEDSDNLIQIISTLKGVYTVVSGTNYDEMIISKQAARRDLINHLLRQLEQETSK